MAKYNFQVCALMLMWLSFSPCTESQRCIKGARKLDITNQGYTSPIVLKAKVTAPSKENHTAEVTYLFETKTGGLHLKDSIVFGPVTKIKGCPKIRKGSEYILFLEEASPPGSNIYRLKYDPVTKMNQLKKLKKVLCAGCVKAPGFKAKNKRVELKESATFNFNCKVLGNPKPKAVFLKDGKPLPSKQKGMKIKIKKKGGGGRLKITDLKQEHAGVYTCQATNIAGNASLSYTLTVKKDDCTPCPKEKQDFCFNGRCCTLPEVNRTFCRCRSGYTGKRCHKLVYPFLEPVSNDDKFDTIEARYHQQTVAIMAVCIALLVVVLICYIVYCKFKKSRSQLRKQLLAQNGHANGRVSDQEDQNERPITTANSDGIVGGDSPNRDVELTGYRSTNLTESHSPQPTSFAQRPQTYDDVILTATAGESQPLVSQDPLHTPYAKRDEVKQVNSRRKRKNGIAVEHSGQRRESPAASDTDGAKAKRRIDEIRRNRDSIVSTASSQGSHHELRRPKIPIDEHLASMAMSGVHRPPAYSDMPDSPHYSHELQPMALQDQEQQPSSSHAPRSGSVSSANSPSNRERAMSSSGSINGQRATTFDSDIPMEDNVMGTRSPVQPRSPGFLSDSSSQYLPKSDQNVRAPLLASQEPQNSHLNSKGKLPYQKESIGPVSPYSQYGHNPEGRLHSPSSYRHDSGDLPHGTDVPETSAQMLDNQRRSQPSSPRLYPSNPGMGIPYHHAPVTVASARTHHLPLLRKENVESPTDNSQKGIISTGSAISLSSSSSDLSQDTERNRNSHKIEV